MAIIRTEDQPKQKHFNLMISTIDKIVEYSRSEGVSMSKVIEQSFLEKYDAWSKKTRKRKTVQKPIMSRITREAPKNRPGRS